MKQRAYTAIVQVLAAASTAILLAIAASSQTETILYTFTGGNDGGDPYAGLAADSNGNLYGTAQAGGTDDGGVVFELSPGTNGTWTYNVIYNFTGFIGTGDGAGPTGGVTIDNRGNLYGTTAFAGANWQGAVYELSPGANGVWTERVLYSFTGASDGGGGVYISEGLIIDAAGNLYGTSSSGANGYGLVFELTPSSGETWTENILHTFTGANDGSYPYSRLALDAAGHLYGVANEGGPHDYGVLFELLPGSNRVWTEKIVHAFMGVDGSAPFDGFTIDQNGQFYFAGGYNVSELTASSSGTTLKNLHEFTGGSDGASSQNQLIFDNSANLYGTTYSGGLHLGTVYKLTRTGNGMWTEKILHRFTGGNDGKNPNFGPLALDAAGNVYGATTYGGASNYGVVFQIKP
jgi:uncharacterized repeat protein (TIGR03803 family)